MNLFSLDVQYLVEVTDAIYCIHSIRDHESTNRVALLAARFFCKPMVVGSIPAGVVYFFAQSNEGGETFSNDYALHIDRPADVAI